MATIIFTGGHHNSALVVALELKKLGHKVVWIGHKFTIRGDKAVSAEYQEVTKNHIPFLELKTGKFYRKKNPFEYLKIILGFFQSLIYLLQTKPNLIVSFGGYLSVPVVMTGWLLRIPSVTHEQTVTAGWANKAISPFVRKIFLTHQSSKKNFPKHKSLVTGLPLRSSLLESIKYKKPKLKIIYITCGKQGSHIINQSLFPLIPKLVTKYKVIHQTGATTLNSDQDRARKIKQALPGPLASRYVHKPYFFGSEATKYLKLAHFVISRSGAHTTYELMVLKKPSIVIPIPWVSHNEQHQNAELLKLYNPTIIIPEIDLTSESLHKAIAQITKIKPSRRPITIPINATQKIIEEITPYLR